MTEPTGLLEDVEYVRKVIGPGRARLLRCEEESDESPQAVFVPSQRSRCDFTR